MTIAEMQQHCYDTAKSKGWCDRVVPIPEMVALIHSEASEALESFRNNDPITFTDEDGKPQGVASEFADILIRIAHYSQVLGINLQYEVLRKMEYNRSRPYRHGGKLI